MKKISINDEFIDFLVLETFEFALELAGEIFKAGEQLDKPTIKKYIRGLADGTIKWEDFTLNGIHTSKCQNIAKNLLGCSRSLRKQKEENLRIREEVQKEYDRFEQTVRETHGNSIADMWKERFEDMLTKKPGEEWNYRSPDKVLEEVLSP